MEVETNPRKSVCRNDSSDWAWERERERDWTSLVHTDNAETCATTWTQLIKGENVILTKISTAPVFMHQPRSHRVLSAWRSVKINTPRVKSPCSRFRCPGCIRSLWRDCDSKLTVYWNSISPIMERAVYCDCNSISPPLLGSIEIIPR